MDIDSENTKFDYFRNKALYLFVKLFRYNTIICETAKGCKVVWIIASSGKLEDKDHSKIALGK